jgi:hypothetical protein
MPREPARPTRRAAQVAREKLKEGSDKAKPKSPAAAAGAAAAKQGKPAAQAPPAAQDPMKDGTGQDKQEKHAEKKADNDDQAAPLPEKVWVMQRPSADDGARVFLALPAHAGAAAGSLASAITSVTV